MLLVSLTPRQPVLLLVVIRAQPFPAKVEKDDKSVQNASVMNGDTFRSQTFP